MRIRTRALGVNLGRFDAELLESLEHVAARGVRVDDGFGHGAHEGDAHALPRDRRARVREVHELSYHRATHEMSARRRRGGSVNDTKDVFKRRPRPRRTRVLLGEAAGDARREVERPTRGVRERRTRTCATSGVTPWRSCDPIARTRNARQRRLDGDFIFARRVVVLKVLPTVTPRRSRVWFSSRRRTRARC